MRRGPLGVFLEAVRVLWIIEPPAQPLWHVARRENPIHEPERQRALQKLAHSSIPLARFSVMFFDCGWPLAPFQRNAALHDARVVVVVPRFDPRRPKPEPQVRRAEFAEAHFQQGLALLEPRPVGDPRRHDLIESPALQRFKAHPRRSAGAGARCRWR